MADASMGDADRDRYAREQAFHDHRYIEDVRAPAAKYYSIARRPKEFYRRACLNAGVGKDVLEYGCGPAGIGHELAAAGSRVTGIDLSPVAIRLARRRAAARGLEMTFRTGNAEALALPDGSFDVVCGTGILHHVDLDVASSEVSRVLRAGGHAFFLEPLGHNPLINLYRRFTPTMRTLDEHPIEKTDLALLRRHFTEVEPTFFGLTALLTVPARKLANFERIEATAHRIDAAVFARIPPLQWWSWIVVLELRK